MKRTVDDIIRTVARRYGVTEQETLTEMQAVIDIGYHSPDPDAQARWASMPFDRAPTPQELIAYLGEKLIRETLR